MFVVEEEEDDRRTKREQTVRDGLTDVDAKINKGGGDCNWLPLEGDKLDRFSPLLQSGKHDDITPPCSPDGTESTIEADDAKKC